jgi:uridine kinase
MEPGRQPPHGISAELQKGEKGHMKKPVFIGIAGGTGSGKSTFTNRLKETFGENVAVVYYDNYYRRRDDLPFEERKKINYDHPDAFETDLLIEHIHALREGKTIECPVYDYTAHNRSGRTVAIRPTEVILVEGIMVLQNEELRKLLDIKVYVEADADERILRRVIRDVKERGRDVEGIAMQYLTTVKPMHYLYVEPTRALADIVINSGMNDVAFDLIRSKIMLLLQGSAGAC